VVLHLTLAHAQVPDPPTMPQDGTQIMTFSGTIQAPSPYFVATQSLVINLPTTELFEHSKPQTGGSAKVEGMRLMYSGLKDTAPFATEPMGLRFRQNHQFVHFMSVDRSIWV
jgi:hypothetical protein